ncbi:MAP7 domain-containing protein 2-like [Lingula anatina]|uniref:MAP7 domain-containing protein 2-like n=1 Tax=Lingula anatina TaxID=7574 RepID=A0A1S3ITL8_LINAN|nr:MAP7 domain-containing protein 2-like [Lingula anatina]|eukprot:XP_013401555.1 MAP7 domain-containing protein 2-like [Lingula anatina]
MSVTSVFDFSSESSMNSVLDSVKQGTSFSPLAPSSEELYDLSSSLNLIDGAEISKGVVLPSASDFTIYLTSSEQHSPTLLVDVFGYFATVISSSSTAEVFKSTSVLTERISLSATTLISAEILGGTLATLEAPESSATGTSLTTVSAIPNTGSPSTTPPAVIVTMSPEAEENRMVLTLHIPFTEMVLEGEKLIREIEKGLVISYHLAVKKVNHSRSKRQAGLGTSQDVEVHITEVKNATNSNYNDLVDVIFYMTKNGSVMKSDHIEKTFNKLSNSELSLKVGYAVETGVRPLVTRKENPTTRPSWLIAAISVPVLLVIILLLVSVYLWKNMTCGAEDHVERGPKESLEMHNLGVDVERGAIVQIGRNGKSLPLLDTPSVSPMKPPKMKNEEKEKNLCNSDTIEHEHRMMRSREISNVSGRSSKGKQKRRILEVETDESDRESQTSSASSREGESDRELSRQETKEVNRASHSKTAKSRKKSKGKRRLPPLRPKKSSKVAPLVVKSALTTSHESLTSDAGNMDEEAEVHEAAVFENIAKLSRIEEPPPAKPERPPVRFKNIITPAPGPALTAYLSSLPPLDIQEEEEDTVATDKKESKTGIPIKLVDPFREEEQNGSDPDITLKEKAAIERMKNKQRHREKAKQEEKKKRRSKKTKEERQAWDKAQSQIEAVLQSDDPPTVPHKKQHDAKSQRQNQSSEDEEEMEERKPTRNMRAGHKKQPRQETEYSSRPFLTKPPAHDAWQANSELPGFTRVAATPAQQKELMKKQHSLLAKQQMQREQHEYKKSLEEHARQLINETLVQQDLETENDDSGSDKVTSKADRSKMPIHKPQEHEDSAVETILKEGRILHSRETPRRNADSSPFSRENTKDSVNRLNRKESSFDMTLKEDLRKVIQDELRSLNR